MNRIKVALIGCGFFGKQLADSFHKANAELVGFTDLNLSLANQLADKFSVNAYADAEELLEKTVPALSGIDEDLLPAGAALVAREDVDLLLVLPGFEDHLLATEVGELDAGA